MERVKARKGRGDKVEKAVIGVEKKERKKRKKKKKNKVFFFQAEDGIRDISV